MKYYIIAGEASGDLHGSNLMKALKKKDPQADFRVWGGDRMAAEGGELVKHFKDLAFMGFVEVVMNLRTILGNLRFCKSDLDDYNPDALILIDYPGFNLRMAEYAHLKGYKVIYYISPQIWAWKQNRVHKIKRTVDRMLCILPFEKEFYARFDFDVDFVGHPLIDAIDGREVVNPVQRKDSLGLSEKPVIALLPGSRKQEISSMLPVMLKAVQKKKDYQVVIAAAPSQDRSFYEDLIGNAQVEIVEGRTYDLLEVADAALVTSGTATLETALFKVPEVVCYKGSWMSYWIARQLVKVNYISLVNLIMDKEVVTELIQGEMNPRRVEKELDLCLKGGHRKELLENYDDLIEKLGGIGASDNAADIIAEEVGL
ncbi:MAG: lipid-A-disaccharide synthase [Owenweeksia sp.]|nr:lipid-A-disaccharide synthase [Owenweeksia sp.]MBF97482.1 lipid-A-disaccharide synthase [Owenweeksia sp.]HBF19748.1 lipid-A-disaccharide synthase [Cryomorphaceae bacterium]